MHCRPDALVERPVQVVDLGIPHLACHEAAGQQHQAVDLRDVGQRGGDGFAARDISHTPAFQAGGCGCLLRALGVRADDDDLGARCLGLDGSRQPHVGRAAKNQRQKARSPACSSGLLCLCIPLVAIRVEGQVFSLGRNS